jgi:hypothetical protein
MRFTWYGNQSQIEGRNFGALAIIVPLLERMNVAQIIDHHLPADPQAEYSYGQLLSLLVAARVHQPLALSRIPEWAEETGADILWNIPAEKLNDDRLGRALDALFTQRHSILASVALHVAREFNVPLREVHYDPTHILFRGAYDESAPRESLLAGGTPRSDETLEPAHITAGRAMDDAPRGAQMVHAGICTYVDEFGPLPIFGHTVDGNQNGRTAVAEQLALLKKHLPFPQLTMLSDRGTFSAGHLMRLEDAGGWGLCSAPWDEFRPLFDAHRDKLRWKTASYLSLEQQRRRARNSDLPQEHYELAVVPHELTDAESKRSIACRVLFVFSTADQKVVRQQRQKQIDKLRTGLEQIERSVAAGRRGSDEAAVTRRVAKLFGSKQAAEYFHWELIPLSAAQRRRLPPPERGCKLPLQRFTFRFDQAAVERDEQYDGYSALVTTVPQAQGSAVVLFTKFKQQGASEQVNSEFKGPLAVRPVFLHSPRRVEALMFLMLLALMLYFLLQRIYRQSVPADAAEKERRTTTQTLLRAFSTYVLLVHQAESGQIVQPTRLTTRQREILRALGFRTPAEILSKRLPRGP